MTSKTVKEKIALKKALKFARITKISHVVWFDDEYNLFRIDSYDSYEQDPYFETAGKLIYIAHVDGYIE